MRLFDYKLNSFSGNLCVSSFIKELENYLVSTPTTYYSIDRFEDSFAVCENRKTLKLKNIPISSLPITIQKNSVLKHKNGKYILDNSKTKHCQHAIRKKVEKLYIK